jgi:hypothetical protein
VEGEPDVDDGGVRRTAARAAHGTPHPYRRRASRRHQGPERRRALSRPDAKNWAAKEIVCHLRDTEEVFAARIEQVRVMDVDPRWGDSNADRMAEERQYLRNDAEQALVAFRRRRAETLDLFAGLAPGQWEKSGIHPVRGRFTIDAILSVMAWHDDNHLAQLIRALEGRV